MSLLKPNVGQNSRAIQETAGRLSGYAQQPGRLSGPVESACGGPLGGKKIGGSSGRSTGGAPCVVRDANMGHQLAGGNSS